MNTRKHLNTVRTNVTNAAKKTATTTKMVVTDKRVLWGAAAVAAGVATYAGTRNPQAAVKVAKKALRGQAILVAVNGGLMAAATSFRVGVDPNYSWKDAAKQSGSVTFQTMVNPSNVAWAVGYGLTAVNPVLGSVVIVADLAWDVYTIFRPAKKVRPETNEAPDFAYGDFPVSHHDEERMAETYLSSVFAVEGSLMDLSEKDLKKVVKEFTRRLNRGEFYVDADTFMALEGNTLFHFMDVLAEVNEANQPKVDLVHDLLTQEG